MKYRLHAFFLHFFISVFLVGIVLSLILFIWYPAPLLKAAGALSIAGLIILVDVVVGPLLTAIVYKKNKKSLALDLSIICLLQLAALGYGVWTLAVARPVWLVFNVDRFDVVGAHEVDYRRNNDIKPAFLNPSWSGPRWVAARVPSDAGARNTLTFESVIHGIDLPQRPDLYVSLEAEKEAISKVALPLADLKRYNPESKINELKADWPQADAYLPLNAKAHSMTVLLEKESGRIVAIVDLRPWK